MPRLALIALVFGVLTVFAGGGVLSGAEAVKGLAGEVVLFVLWFNFFAGFVYLVAAAGLWLGKPWAVGLSGLIAMSSLVVLIALGAHILNGGAFEIRTPLAMGFRTLVWTGIYLYARRINKHTPGTTG